MPLPFVKICGLSDIATMRLAESLGASHIGLIVEVPRSPRNLDRGQARVMAHAARAASAMVTTASDPDVVCELASSVQPSVVQLHTERPLVGEVRRRLPGVELWQVVSVDVSHAEDAGAVEGAVREIAAAAAAGADKILLDASVKGRSGGLGVAMDWGAAAEIVQGAGDVPVILAGGLHPGNVAEAMRRVRPAGVDVSSGVESAPNVKSTALIRAFFRSVRAVTLGDRT